MAITRTEGSGPGAPERADGRRGGAGYLRALGVVFGLALVVAGLVPVVTTAEAPSTDITALVPSASHVRTTRLINVLLRKYHYRKVSLDNTLSASILDRYLDNLDPNRSFFIAQDIQEFKRHRYRFDDYLRAAQLKPAFAIFSVYRKRVQDRVDHALELLEQDFDFSVDEEYQYDRRDTAWPVDEAALDELWRKRVKNDVLNLQLADRNMDEIRDTLRKRYEGLGSRTAQLNADDIFALFTNAYVGAVEPHTAYFSPRNSENFRIRMSLSLEGIGAVLQREDEFTLVRRIVPGGPADMSGLLHSGDRIIGVGQGDDPVVDVIGWRLDDVVDLIRGPKDTVVRLKTLPKGTGPNGPSEIIRLTRNKIKLEEQAAQKSVHEFDQNGTTVRIGVIELPTFYIDFEARARGDEEYRSTTRDVKRLLGELMDEGVDGVVIDLRSNGGGSLTEATSLTGLFIQSGPIVQVRDSQGDIQVNRDPDPAIEYSGPLAVLVDRDSASASEIFAGAIQDYGRGLVIGEPTYGKGTVQNLVSLDNYVESDAPLGQLKVTIAQFFRVNGDSTQHRGVVPDIVFPTAVDSDEHGERALDNALPWATVQAARFVPHSGRSAKSALDRTRQQHEDRIRDHAGFAFLIDRVEGREAAEDDKIVSLLETERRDELETRQDEARDSINRLREALGLPPLPERDADDASQDDESASADDGSATDEEDEVPGDVMLVEATRILADYVTANRETFEPEQTTAQTARSADELLTMTRDDEKEEKEKSR